MPLESHCLFRFFKGLLVILIASLFPLDPLVLPLGVIVVASDL